MVWYLTSHPQPGNPSHLNIAGLGPCILYSSCPVNPQCFPSQSQSTDLVRWKGHILILTLWHVCTGHFVLLHQQFNSAYETPGVLWMVVLGHNFVILLSTTQFHSNWWHWLMMFILCRLKVYNFDMGCCCVSVETYRWWVFIGTVSMSI